jgi:hypothetical protein
LDKKYWGRAKPRIGHQFCGRAGLFRQRLGRLRSKGTESSKRRFRWSDPDTYASYETKKFTDPTRTFTSNDLFGGEAVVRVRQSVLESDRGLSAVLGHEYFEINGLAGRGAMQYGDINGAIDGLHNQAVNYGDNIVRQMINGGL